MPSNLQYKTAKSKGDKYSLFIKINDFTALTNILTPGRRLLTGVAP